jgi:hypothetical protein
MSKQFRFFLLPEDIDRFTDELRSKVEFEVFEKASPTSEAKKAPTAFQRRYQTESGVSIKDVYCLLAPVQAAINVRYYPTRAEWLIDEEKSEVIQFCGCRFDGVTLHVGRFYAMTDMLIGDAIWRKQDSFLKWVDRVYRAAKKLLKYSKDSDVYVGPAAEEWIRRGGKISQI